MIRDRIVVGLIDANVSQKLQLDPDLTLKKAQDIVRETDAVKKQQSELRNKADFPDNGVDSIRSAKHKKSRREQNNKATGKSNQKDFPGKQSCFRCGKNPSHSRENVLQEIPRVTSVLKLDIGLKSAELKWSRRWSKKTVMMMQIMNSLVKYHPKTMLSGKRI